MITIKKIQKSGFWQAIEVLGVNSLNIVYLAIMARLLEKSDFGLMAIVVSILAFGNVFSEAGMGSALIQRKNITDNHKSAALHFSFLLAGFLFTIYLISSKGISLFFGYPEISYMLQLLSISLFFNALCSVSISLMQKNFSFKLISFVTLTSDFISFLLGIIFAFLGYGVWSLVYVALSRSILKALGYFYFAPIKFGSKFYFKEYKELFSFGSGIILIKIGNFIGANGINLILGKILAPEIFGVFDRANKIKGIPIRLLSSVWNKVMFPVMSEIQDEKERVFKLYNFGIGISNVLLMPLTTLLIFFADEIVFILLGSKWIEAVLPLQILF